MFKSIRDSFVEATRQVSSTINDQMNAVVPPKQYRVKDMLLEEERELSEGGFAFVSLARDVNTGRRFVLKKMFCQDKERVALAEREVAAFERIPPHPNVVRFFGHTVEQQGPQRLYVLVLQFLPGGHLLDLLNQNDGVLSESQIIPVIRDITAGLVHLHSLGIQHRDLKIENVLKCNQGKYVLVDLGSWSSEVSDTRTLERSNLLKLEDTVERYTTMMYRPPEMADLYKGYIINTQVDMWMLGCVLYTLMMNKHPFQDESKLAIANARFHVDVGVFDRFSGKLVDLLYWLLAMNPVDRPTSLNLSKVLDHWEDGGVLKLPNCVIERREKEAKLYGRPYLRKSAERPTVKEFDAFADFSPVVVEQQEEWAVWNDEGHQVARQKASDGTTVVQQSEDLLFADRVSSGPKSSDLGSFDFDFGFLESPGPGAAPRAAVREGSTGNPFEKKSDPFFDLLG